MVFGSNSWILRIRRRLRKIYSPILILWVLFVTLLTGRICTNTSPSRRLNMEMFLYQYQWIYGRFVSCASVFNFVTAPLGGSGLSCQFLQRLINDLWSSFLQAGCPVFIQIKCQSFEGKYRQLACNCYCYEQLWVLLVFSVVDWLLCFRHMIGLDWLIFCGRAHQNYVIWRHCCLVFDRLLAFLHCVDRYLSP